MPEQPRKQRCTARTTRGKRCRNWAVPADPQSPLPDPQLCAIHARDRPAANGGQRCTARRRDGGQCSQWAVPGSNPPRCHTHGPGINPGKGERRRCTARTQAGTRCRNWATRDTQATGEGLCRYHQVGRRLPRGDDRRRCTALTATGQRCRKWAVRSSSHAPRPDPQLCAIHLGRAGNHPARPADYAAGRVCTATTVHGRRCKKWALAHTDPPLCWIHAYPDLHPNIRHGFLRRTAFLPAPARAAIRCLVESGQPLAAEIALLRLKIRALLAYLGRPDLSGAEWLPAYRLLVRALPLVARLLRTQQALEAAEEALPGDLPAPDAVLGPSSGGWLTTALEAIVHQDATHPTEDNHDH